MTYHCWVNKFQYRRHYYYSKPPIRRVLLASLPRVPSAALKNDPLHRYDVPPAVLYFIDSMNKLPQRLNVYERFVVRCDSVKKKSEVDPKQILPHAVPKWM